MKDVDTNESQYPVESLYGMLLSGVHFPELQVKLTNSWYQMYITISLIRNQILIV
jgi:hypothetical protein